MKTLWLVSYALDLEQPAVSFHVDAPTFVAAVAKAMSVIKTLHPPGNLTDDVLEQVKGFNLQETHDLGDVSGTVEIRSAQAFEV